MASSPSATQTILRWMGAVAVVGVAAGIWAMFERVPPMAESGHKPTEFWFYAFWIPVGAIVGAVVGIVLGSVVAIGSAALQRLR
jgi:prolipoprotein diacylglyceryltransferase